jgi:hypothetical protein
MLPVLCAICAQDITHFGHDGGSHAFDHITPWSKAPSSDPSNLRHAHKPCKQPAWPAEGGVGGPMPDVNVAPATRPLPTLLAVCAGLGFQNVPESPGTRRAVPFRLTTAR